MFVTRRPQMVLLGDSITQQGGAPGGWATLLSWHFKRRADLLNRGFSGYTVPWAVGAARRSMLDLPSEIELLVVFFGANDASLPVNAAQHVPLTAYRQGLVDLCTELRRKHKVKRLVLATPPPIDEESWLKRMRDDGSTASESDRTLATTAIYAKACKAAAYDLGAACADLFSTLQEDPAWRERLLSDGLHLSEMGNDCVFQAMLETIDSAFPELKLKGQQPQDVKCEALPPHLPDWRNAASALVSDLTTPLSRLEAVIFDCDGTLIDSEPIWHTAEIECFRKHAGLVLTEADTLRTTGLRVDAVVEFWFERSGGWDEDDPALLPRAKLTEALVTRVAELIRSQGKVLPGVHAAVAMVRGCAGLKVAVASSSPRVLIEASLARLGLEFEVVCSALEEEYGKPHPAVYLTAARRLGVDPKCCIAIEDSVTGCLAAKAARMRLVAVPQVAGDVSAAFGIADVTLKSLVDLDADVLRRALE